MPFELKPTIEEGLLWHIIGDYKENTDKCKCFGCVILLFTQHTSFVSILGTYLYFFFSVNLRTVQHTHTDKLSPVYFDMIHFVLENPIITVLDTLLFITDLLVHAATTPMN